VCRALSPATAGSLTARTMIERADDGMPRVLGWRGRTWVAARRVSRLAPVLAAGLVGVAMLPAAAAASSPIALDAPDNGNAPLVAYAPSDGYRYVAWSAPGNQNGGNGVDLCVLAPNATSCAGGGPVLLTDTNTGALGTNSSNTVGLGGLVVLPGSGEVVVLGTPVQTGTVAWVSSPGGAAFFAAGSGLQNGGNFISPVSIFYTRNNAAAINSTDVGIFDSYDHFYSYFSDSPFAGPQTPSTLPSNMGNANNGGQFDDQGDTQGPVIAAEPAPPPAPAGTYVVVGAGANISSNESTPSGCINDAATGYGTDVGTTGPSGTLDSQGLQANGFGLLACSAEDPTLASGGTDGIGVLEVEGNGVSGAGSTYTLDFRPFGATATGGSFGAPAQVAQLSSAPNDLDVADDAGTGVYALWSEGGLYVAYSPNGGASWDAPVLVPQPANGAISDPTIAGVGGGVVQVAFTNNPGTGTQTFLQAVDAIPPTPVTVTTSQTAGTTTGADISVPAGTLGETDTATLSGTNASTATGTMTYNLYSNSSCTDLTLPVGTTAVTAGKSISSPVTKALNPGKYYWKAVYSGDALNDPGSTACGSEVLTITAATTLPSSATSNGSTVTLTITCSAACTVTVTIELPTGSASDASDARKKKSKVVTLASGRFKLHKNGKKKLTLKFTPKGKALFKKDHGKLKTILLTSDKTAHGTFKSSKTLKITKSKKK
jgi:hypothetical protein